MLISFSGIDGSGKSTQVALLKDELQRQGYSVVITKAYNDEAKQALRHFAHNWADEARMFLFQAMHANQYDATRTALNSGAIVIADRWDESYFGYHSNFGPLAAQPELREALNKLAFRGLLPDIGFFIDIPVETARIRREQRGKVEKLEDRSDEWYTITQNSYRNIALKRGWYVLDGLAEVTTLHQKIKTYLLDTLIDSTRQA